MGIFKLYRTIFFLLYLILIEPLNLSAQFSTNNLLFWLRSDTALTTIGNSLTNWNDISGNNFNFSSTNSPSVNPNSLGGFQSIYFDNNNMLSNSTTSLTNFNAFIVYKKTGTPIFYERLMDHDYASGFWMGRNGTINHTFGGGYKNTSPPLGIYGSFPDSIANIYYMSKKNNTHNIYNGFNLLANQTLSDFSATTVNKISVGSDVVLTGNFKGEIFEAIFFNDSISNENRDSVLNYIYNKYAKKPNLGPDIITSNSFCDTVLNAGNHFTHYTWSSGATTKTISVNASGQYWVKTIDIFGRIFYDTINVQLNKPINFSFRDSVFCEGNTLKWDTYLPKNEFSFLWNNSSNDSLINITQSGQYYVKITDSNGCFINTDTFSIIEDFFPSLASLGSNIQLCAGNLITLSSGASPSLTYTWSNGSTNDSLLITNAGQYSVIVTNTNNCIAKDTIDITIQGFAPTANFSQNIGCVNQIVSFTDLSIPPSGNTISDYEWSFGDTASPTNTSTAANPSHTYTNTGTYTVNLTVTTNSNCEQSITKIINVYPVPTASFAIGTSCQNDNTAFLNQSTSPSGYSVTSSYWNFGDSSPTNTTSINSPTHIFSNSSIFTVKLLVTNNAGCKDSIYKTVNVQDEVKADFTNGPACLNSPTNFLSTSIIPTSGTPTYDWNFVNSTANTPAPIKTYTNAGVYYVTLTVDGNNGCTSTITKLVNVYLPPIASFSIPSFCAKDTINVINLSNPQSGIISSYNWRLNNITFSTVQSPTLSLANPGNNSIRLTTINSFGCKDSTTNSLTIFPLPLVDFSTTPTAFYYENEPINFMPSITNASSYLWNMNGTSTYSIQSPTETFNTEGSYNVVLNLIDQNGCKGSKTKTITVSKRQLDLAILNVSTTKDNDGFMTVIADIANYGSVPINSFKMGYQISDGGNIKETWNGTLNPNSFYTFTFNALSASMQNSTNNVTCVEIEKVNTGIDDNTTNNFLCNSLNTDDIYVANPLPNPTNGDIILPITLNRGFDYTVAIYNSVGQIQYEETTKKGIEGLNFVTLNTSSYARGAYIIKIMIDEKIFIKKFIKISYE